MNLFKTSLLGAVLASGLLAGGAASAAVVCNGCSHAAPGNGLGATYLGTHNPITADNSTFTHAGIGGGGADPITGALLPAAFDDWWIFDMSPAGLAAINATFILTGNVQNFTLDLYSLPTAAATYGCSTTPSACATTPNNGAFLISATTNPNFLVNLPSQFLTMGTYAFRVQGQSFAPINTSPNSYSGNLSVSKVPEPGSLALVALGMLAAGSVLRRRS